MKIKKFSPCKVNLMLAITGVRDDGFHNLISLVTPTRFGDELSAEISTESTDRLFCNDENVPTDSSNLVLKAAELFRRASNADIHFNFWLDKKVPMGAGLGGGSSNGAAALLAVNELCSNPLERTALEKIASQMGSDCPLFLSNSPVVMRGRGEKVFPLFGQAKEYVGMLRLMLFKPAFSINTGWAYSQMRANPSDYVDPDEAEAKISQWLESPNFSDIPFYNNMQIEAFKKYPSLEIALEGVRQKFNIPALMSGSGSACFAVINDLEEPRVKELADYIRGLFGDSAFIALA